MTIVKAAKNTGGPKRPAQRRSSEAVDRSSGPIESRRACAFLLTSSISPCLLTPPAERPKPGRQDPQGFCPHPPQTGKKCHRQRVALGQEPGKKEGQGRLPDPQACRNEDHHETDTPCQREQGGGTNPGQRNTRVDCQHQLAERSAQRQPENTAHHEG